MWTVIGIVFLIYIAFVFFNQIGKSIPILEFMALISGLQWILGPIIEYRSSYQHYKYHMYVPQEEYMSLVVPAFAAFAIVLLYAAKRYPLTFSEEIDLSEFSNYGLLFVGIGLGAQLAGGFVPESLAFFMVIVSNFKFIGAIILFFSPKRIHQNFFYAAIILLLISSLQSGFFHDFILWGVFFFLYWALKYQPSSTFKIGIFIAGFAMLTAIQSVKMQYRNTISDGYDGNNAALFVNILFDQLEGDYFEEEENTQGLNVRLNQGWIISAVLNHVPQNQDFAGGETVKEAIFASALPRFLNPDKKKAGGRNNFRKYTGLLINKGTSMGISIIGEFYANYGRFAILAMGIWGLLLLWIWRLLYLKQDSIPFIVFFMPLLFLQVVKAETELVVVLNHLVKSSIVIFAFFYFTKNILNWSIYYLEEEEDQDEEETTPA